MRSAAAAPEPSDPASALRPRRGARQNGRDVLLVAVALVGGLLAEWRLDLLGHLVTRLPFTPREVAELFAALLLLVLGAAGLLVRRWLQHARDVRRRERAEAALLRTQRLLADAEALARVGAWDLDLRTGELWWSDENFRLFGLEPGAVTPSHEAFLARLHPEDRDGVVARVDEAMRRGGRFAHRQRVVTPAGETRFQQVRGEVVVEEGRPVRVRGVSLDVSEQHETERALRESEERLTLALEGTGQGLWDWDVATGGVHFSPHWQRMLGYGPGEVPPHASSWERLVHPDDLPGVRGLRDAHLRGETPAYEAEYRVRGGGGAWLWIHSRGRVIERDAGGRPLRMIGTHVDVTARRDAALALDAANGHYRRLVTTSPYGIYRLDEAGRFAEINHAGEALLGRTAAEVMGTHFGAVVADDDLAATAHAFLAVMGGAASLDLELRIRHPGGGQRHVALTATPISHDGAVVGVQGIARDITEERRTEEARARLVQILEATPDLVTLGDAEGQVLYRNPAAQRLLGLPAGEPGRPESFFGGATRPAWAQAVFLEEAVPTAARDGIWMGELALLGPGGAEIPVSQVVIAHPSPDGTPAYFSVVARDLSERRSLEEQLRHAQKMEAVGKLAGGVAHDFNNMLMVIRGFAALLEMETPPGTAAARYLEEIQGAAARSAEITRQLLAFSRRQVLQPQVHDVRAVVEGVDRMLRPLIGADVEVETEPGADPAHVDADPAQLEQVLVNVALNARDAMPGGGRLRIGVAVVALAPAEAAGLPGSLSPGRWVRIDVEDTGAGMDESTLERVFEPFFTTKEVGKGTGLGLSSAYGTVRQSGGQMWAESTPGVGTRVVICLPHAGDEGAPAAAAADDDDGRHGAETVLLVEDESAVRALARVTLERAGYRVIEAADGAQALALATAPGADVDLVVTDVVMPRMGGPELAARLRAARPGLPVLFMSGYTEDVVLHRGVSARERHLLQKPFTGRDLLAVVQGILDGAGRARTAC